MTERARCCLQRWAKKVLRKRAQAVERTNGSFPEFKGSQGGRRGPRVDSGWSAEPVSFVTLCVCVCLRALF